MFITGNSQYHMDRRVYCAEPERQNRELYQRALTYLFTKLLIPERAWRFVLEVLHPQRISAVQRHYLLVLLCLFSSPERLFPPSPDG